MKRANIVLSATALIGLSATALADPQECNGLNDNGVTNGLNGYSNGTEEVVGSGGRKARTCRTVPSGMSRRSAGAP